MDQHVAEFAQKWFDELSNRAPVDRLLTLVSDTGLEMVFPEQTLTSHAEFVDWYEAVGKLFADQTHDVEELRTTVDGDRLFVKVTVRWAGVDLGKGEPFAFRVGQDWTLRRGADGALRIQRYEVGDFTPVPVGAVSATRKES